MTPQDQLARSTPCTRLSRARWKRSAAARARRGRSTSSRFEVSVCSGSPTPWSAPALAPSTTLRVLLLDPDSVAAERRAAEIGESKKSFAAGIQLAIARLAELAEARSELSVECALYSSTPTWRIIAPEPAIFVSSFGADHEGHRSTMYKLTRTERPGSLWKGFRRFLDEHRADARRVL